MKKGIKFGFLCICVLGFFLMGSISFASNWNLPGVKIISREEWGADDSIRLLKNKKVVQTGNQTEAQIESERKASIRTARMDKNYPNDRKYDNSITMSGNMYRLYPDYFNHNKTKIVIHHTAGNYDSSWTKDDVIKEIQEMYKYHTFNRNFGDIGYNFIIDQLGNIYEGRHGGEGSVGMHVSNNNASSIGIALMGNFQNDVPTEAQLSSMINLTTALAKFYKINPKGTTYTFQINNTKEPYVTAKKNYTILGHKDIANTACPGNNLYPFVSKLRDEVSFRLQNDIVGDMPLPSSWIDEINKLNGKNNEKSDTKVKLTFAERLSNLEKNDSDLLNSVNLEMRKRYKGVLIESDNNISKINKKYSTKEVKSLTKQKVSVLLYELTTQYNQFSVKCNGDCMFDIDGIKYIRSGATISFNSGYVTLISNNTYTANKISVGSPISGGTVEVLNYSRKSYAGIPWNKFRGMLTFENGEYPLKEGTFTSGGIVINTLSFIDYMKGIAETNDTETLEKNKVMAMIAKNYALFYLNKDNKHPNIPNNTDYNAIDDSDFFQKYVGAGLEKTLTKRYQALEETKDKIVMYDNYLPILPYFSCSAGFTLSAEEKRGWNDTPYLQSVFDFDYCNDFDGHGVGLAGKGAEYLAKQGLSYQEILKYYYKGVEIKNLK